jgi:hypothetical protein
MCKEGTKEWKEETGKRNREGEGKKERGRRR